MNRFTTTSIVALIVAGPLAADTDANTQGP